MPKTSKETADSVTAAVTPIDTAPLKAALTTAIAFELLGICWSARIVRGPSP